MHMDGTNIQLDRFSGPAEAYFLSHLHADHTRGLEKGWHRGPLYCSALTARLVIQRYGIDEALVHVIEPGETRRLRLDGQDVSVSVIDANHCPGAVMFHFDFGGRQVLYTGDFRLDDTIRREARRFSGVDLAYIDTTYDDEKYVFPSQQESIGQVLRLIGEHMRREIFLAVYSIGKTKLLSAIGEEFGLPVYVSAEMMRTYAAMGLGELVTRDASATNLRGYFRGYYYSYFPWKHRRHRETRTVIIPTGWAVDGEEDRYGYLYVPYSEHCDYRELCEFRRLLRPGKTIPI